MLRGALVLCLIASGLPLTARAGEKEKPLPKDLPPYAAMKPVTAPRVTERKLANGMTLWLVPRPGFPKVAFGLAVRGGMASDPKNLPGLSNLLSATLDQGTRTRSAKQIAEEFQAAGGDLSGAADSDALTVSIEVLAPKADAALAVVADVVQNATFPESEFNLAQRNAAESLRGQEAEPSFLARRALAKALFGDHPYSVMSGTQESIAKATAADLRREYARRFRPDQALLVTVGDFDTAHMTAALEKLVGSWAAPREAPASEIRPPAVASPHAVFLVERPGSVQTTLALGTFGPNQRQPDFAAAEVANAIYGGMFGSRLVKNIREDKGYTYSPFALLQARRATGMLETRADVRNEVTGATFNEVGYEMNRLASTAPGEDELTRAQRYLVGVRAFTLQIAASVARQLAALWVEGLPPEELGRRIERIQKVTAREIEAAGQKYFPASHQTVVAVGEEKVIKDQLAPFGLEIKPAPAP
jgi:predicted Zn-dependent peptidase